MRQWNDAQRRAIETTGRGAVCVTAAAGSGKTSVLIERIARLVETRKAELDEIVAITFTEAAAGEMRERLRALCRERSRNADRDTLSFWRGIQRNLDTARISTIHAFCAGILRSHAIALGRDPDFALLTEAESQLLREETARRTVLDLIARQDPHTLEAASHFGTARLIREATAMLGSQRGVLEDAAGAAWLEDTASLQAQWRESEARLYEEAVASPSVRRDLESLRDALEERGRAFAGDAKAAEKGREALRRSMVAALNLYLADPSAANAQAAFQALAQRVPGRSGKDDWANEEDKAAIEALQKAAKTYAEKWLIEPLSEEDAREAAAYTHALIHVGIAVVAAYRETKARRVCADFDDLIADTRRVLEEHEDVCASVARGIGHLLVDEFQDTDAAQYRIVRLLCSANPHLELFIVGDPKQSIYRFRGAEVALFQRARESDAQERILLDANYRSRAGLLDALNGFFWKTGLLEAVEPSYQPMQAHRKPATGLPVRFVVAPEPEEGEDRNADEARLAEARLLGRYLRSAVEGPEPWIVGDENRPAQYGDAAMLLRAFSSLHIYERGLQEAGVPYQVESGRGFYERQEVRDLANLLRIVANPYDEMAVLGFLRSPLGGLSDEQLARLCAKRTLARVFHDAGAAPDFAPQLDAAKALAAGLRKEAERPLADFLRIVLERTRFEAILLARPGGEQRAANLRKLIELADGVGRTGAMPLAAFAAYLEEAARSELREGDVGVHAGSRDAVTVMTVHAAKGLEFPLVLLADVARPPRSGRGPHCRIHAEFGAAAAITNGKGEACKPALAALLDARDSQGDAEESARLLYVALTRARDGLIISGALPDRAAPWRPSSRGSWMDWLAGYFGIAQRPAGLVAGEAPAFQKTQQHRPEFQPSDAVQVLRRVAPLAPAPPLSRQVAASTLAAALAEEGPPQRTEHAFAHKPGAVDPLLRGTALHGVLQSWDFCSDPAPLAERITLDLCPSRQECATLTAYCAARAMAFAATPLGQRIAGEPAALREQRFALRLGETLVAGAIDLLLPGGVIVDYKTGASEGAHAAAYAWQLRLYALAFEALHDQSAREAHLAYVDTGETVAVELSPSLLAETRERALALLPSLYDATGSEEDP